MLSEPDLRLHVAPLTPAVGCSDAKPSRRPELRPAPAAAKGPARLSPVYNLFRHRGGPDLFCAVPGDCRVPTFIKAPDWTFAGRTTDAQQAFDPDAASTAVPFNEFCLFVTGCAPRRGSAQRQRF